MSYFAALEYTLSVTGPVFLIVFIGLWLKLNKKISESFIQEASSLVFTICLPILIFLSILNSSVDWESQFTLIGFCLAAAFVSFVVIWWLSAFVVGDEDRGVAVQGAFRSNLGIIGLALCAKGFGDSGLAIGAVILAVVTPLFNILSVYGLNRSINTGRTVSLLKTVKDIAKNPLIIAITLAFICLYLELQLPKVAHDAGTYLAQMTLPLALISIGGALSLSELRRSSQVSMYVVFAKLILVPICVTLAAYMYGFKGAELGCIMLMFAGPTATASFVMVRAMGGNYVLASNIIVISTLCSALSISILLYLAKLLEWI